MKSSVKELLEKLFFLGLKILESVLERDASDDIENDEPRRSATLKSSSSSSLLNVENFDVSSGLTLLLRRLRRRLLL